MLPSDGLHDRILVANDWERIADLNVSVLRTRWATPAATCGTGELGRTGVTTSYK